MGSTVDSPVSQFYRDFRKMCLILGPVGSVSIGNLKSGSSSSLGFSKLLCAYAVSYMLLVNAGVEYYQRSLGIHYVPYQILVYQFVATFTTNTLGQTEIVRLFRLLEGYDSSFSTFGRDLVAQTPTYKKFLPLIVSSCIYATKLTIVSLYMSKCSPFTYLYTFSSVTMTGILCMYLFFTREIEERFLKLNRRFDEDVAGGKCISSRLETVRKQHLVLTRSVRTLREAFGPQLLAMFSSLAMNVLCAIYIISKDAGSIAYLSPIGLFFMGFTGVISFSTHNMITQSRQLLRNTFHVPLTNLDPASQFQMSYLCQQLMNTEEEVTCLDLFTIDMSFLGSFSTLLATYTIAILQIPWTPQSQ